ncbi:MAG TPA: hypothetical protein VGL28_06600 [Steroidobacteraceae bacterium]|jgi:hypothetical protein
MKILIGLLLLGPGLALADSPFDGTWKTRVDTIKQTGKPDVLVVAHDMYRCESCVPQIKVKADGSDQAVTGHAYYDTVAAKIVSSSSIEITNKKAGKTTLTVAYSVTDDGNTLNGKFTDFTGAQPVTGNFTEKRVAAGPAGANKVSGSWKADKISDIGDAGTTLTYAMGADSLKMSSNGVNYDAKFDGKDYPMSGDPGNTMVSLKHLGSHTVQETDKRDGKVTDVVHSSVSKDGKSLHVVDEDKIHGVRTSYTMEKQS